MAALLAWFRRRDDDRYVGRHVRRSTADVTADDPERGYIIPGKGVRL